MGIFNYWCMSNLLGVIFYEKKNDFLFFSLLIVVLIEMRFYVFFVYFCCDFNLFDFV